MSKKSHQKFLSIQNPESTFWTASNLLEVCFKHLQTDKTSMLQPFWVLWGAAELALRWWLSTTVTTLVTRSEKKLMFTIITGYGKSRGAEQRGDAWTHLVTKVGLLLCLDSPLGCWKLLEYLPHLVPGSCLFSKLFFVVYCSFFDSSLLSAFLLFFLFVSLLFCFYFYASLVFFASLLFCFVASTLLRCFCFSAFLFLCFVASLLYVLFASLLVSPCLARRQVRKMSGHRTSYHVSFLIHLL